MKPTPRRPIEREPNAAVPPDTGVGEQERDP